jgi:chemotaxis family two-component system response regulator Rcp1
MTARRKILVVDDNPDDVDLLRIAMEGSGLVADIEVACDGRQAIAALQRDGGADGPTSPRLVVLDLNMPIMNGHEVLARMQADASLRRIPVIVLTTSDAPADRNRCLASGAREYLVKPRRFADFAPIIVRLRAHLEDGPGDALSRP